MEWLKYADRDVLDEVEIRQLLIDHVGHRCCWGSRPARTWKITSIEDCNVYVGTLETFIEERDTVTNKEPYDGGKIDGRDKGPVLAVWELDLRSEFPLLFVPEKEVMVKIPHSEVIEKCLGMVFILKHSFSHIVSFADCVISVLPNYNYCVSFGCPSSYLFCKYPSKRQLKFWNIFFVPSYIITLILFVYVVMMLYRNRYVHLFGFF